jgi:hypothetical protein
MLSKRKPRPRGPNPGIAAPRAPAPVTLGRLFLFALLICIAVIVWLFVGR